MSQLLPEQRSRLAPEGWQPLSELEQVTERMRRMLDQTFGSFDWPSPAEARGWSPLVDIEEADDAYVVDHGRGQGARAQGRAAPADAANGPLRVPGRSAGSSRGRQCRREPL